MTWHFFDGDDIDCPSCGANYLPFEEAQPCPRCGTPSAEYFRFLDDVVAALRIHKSQYGTYCPPAYFVGGAAERNFLHVARWLDALEQDGGEINDAAIAAQLQEVEWGEYEYLRSYFQLLLDRVSRRLADDDGDCGEGDAGEDRESS
jgi:hypothetical protein